MLLTLPWPPSVNTYYRNIGKRVLISKRGRQYRKDVGTLCIGAQRLGHARLHVRIDLYPPDRRRRDIDNAVKAIFDSLQHAGIYDDDSQIDLLIVERRSVERGGRAEVLVKSV